MGIGIAAYFTDKTKPVLSTNYLKWILGNGALIFAVELPVISFHFVASAAC